MKTVIILACRIDSTRLPKKLLLPILDMPMIELIIKRLKKSKKADSLIVATTEKTYPFIKNILERNNTGFFLGSEEDVLNRYYLAAKKEKANLVIRTTGDNPLVCVEAIDSLIDKHKKHKPSLSHYIGLPYGAGVEAISFEALEEANEKALNNFEREHITQYIYKNKNDILSPEVDTHLNMESLRVTVDTEKDYLSVKSMFERFGDNIDLSVREIIASMKD